MDRDRAVVAGIGFTPGRLKEILLREGAPGLAHHGLEEVELDAGELKWGARYQEGA